MARIRSVHPGLFTDEAFASLSDAAQVLWIGLWTEADDQGIFEWKPITLKMRLRPASTVSVEPLLAELESADCIRRFSRGGREYGAVRNFQRFQRPKKPNSVHFMPPEFRTYLGCGPPSSEPDGVSAPSSSELSGAEVAPVPPKSEIAPQMEDGGGKEKKPTLRVVKEPRQKPRSQIGSDWAPDAAGVAYAEARGVPRSELRRFIDHHQAKGSLMADWAAAWRTWCENAVRFGSALPFPKPRDDGPSPMVGGF